MDSRPILHALVAWYSPAFGVLGDPTLWPKVMPLEDAVDYARAGAVVLVDPQDERDLAMHERLLRAVAPRRRKWFEVEESEI